MQYDGNHYVTDVREPTVDGGGAASEWLRFDGYEPAWKGVAHPVAAPSTDEGEAYAPVLALWECVGAAVPVAHEREPEPEPEPMDVDAEDVMRDADADAEHTLPPLPSAMLAALRRAAQSAHTHADVLETRFQQMEAGDDDGAGVFVAWQITVRYPIRR